MADNSAIEWTDATPKNAGRRMNMLVAYDRLRAALAEANQVKDVLEIRAELEHVKLYARQVKDRALLAEATDTQTRTERRLGEFLLEAEKLGWIGRGRPKKPTAENVNDQVHFTLDEAGIDRNMSSRAQKLAKLPAEQFERGISDVRERIVAGGSTTINGARAIMGSREEPSDSLDFFPTPPWATRALLERVFPQVVRRSDCHRQTAWEPACGEGHIAEVLREYFVTVLASDIHDYGYGAVSDFLSDPLYDRRGDWIITNPPFAEKSEAFLLRALELARIGVAIFVRLQWLETEGRYERVFSVHPPTLIAFFAERVNLCKGRWDPEGGTATAYIWLLWVRGQAPRAPFWIAPGCRKQLARDGDDGWFTKHPVAKRIGDELEWTGEVA